MDRDRAALRLSPCAAGCRIERAGRGPARPALAVLPFANLGSDPEQDGSLTA